MDHDGIADHSDRDRDGDGIPNARDPNPNVPNGRHIARVDRFGPNGDFDHDGILNRNDRDRDGDGVRNARDRAPDDPRRA
ncbi:thrombospondin type 3 repeat-containing protein [Ramlibacter monticola]|uniref:Thrombospondin type 3 repeat-containing protein n=2 Tax=Ramlibacter monticola TaxID=1926872 RepID=A0A936YYD9_9BURK|nr:thrombospondin type 3 repeat-containing protein [Ramlibacter monticola]